MGEAARAAYEVGVGSRAAGAAKRITVDEFRLRIGAVRTRRVNAETAYRHHEDLEFGGGWTTKGHARLHTEVLEARSEELRLVHLLLGEQYTVEMGEVGHREQPCLVEGGGK